MNPFPIPVVALGPGSQIEDDTPDYMHMPRGMNTFRPPVLPDAENLAGHTPTKVVLHAILDALAETVADARNRLIDLSRLASDDHRLLNQILGEGEVGARVEGEYEALIQESVFAGVWHVVTRTADYIEVGDAPGVLVKAARHEAQELRMPESIPDEVMNAPSILTELHDQVNVWQPGALPHVVNLTLLPLSGRDVDFLDSTLGQGDVTVLSRGYGNCRISATRTRCCWRVVYFNSEDAMILNTIEVTDLPEVVRAAPDDLRDSHERLVEVLSWVEQA